MVKTVKFVLCTIAVGTLTLCAVWVVRGHAAAQRQAVYEARLASLNRDFLPGMSRSEVESKLQAKRLSFSQGRSNHGSYPYADEILLGNEPAPWYCSFDNVYLSFAFDGREQPASQKDPADRLETLTLVHLLEDCL